MLQLNYWNNMRFLFSHWIGIWTSWSFRFELKNSMVIEMYYNWNLPSKDILYVASDLRNKENTLVSLACWVVTLYHLIKFLDFCRKIMMNIYITNFIISKKNRFSLCVVSQTKPQSFWHSLFQLRILLFYCCSNVIRLKVLGTAGSENGIQKTELSRRKFHIPVHASC